MKYYNIKFYAEFERCCFISPLAGLFAKNHGEFINSAGNVAVGGDSVWMPLQVIIDKRRTYVILD